MKYIFVIAVVALVLVSNFGNNQVQNIKINGTNFDVEVADTDEERITGLSGRNSFGPKKALLFDFKKEGYYGIWMKDMNFPIDIAWLDKDKKIIYIEKNVGPETYPKVFYPYVEGLQSLSIFVLETPAGFFENNKIKIGDQLEF